MLVFAIFSCKTYKFHKRCKIHCMFYILPLSSSWFGFKYDFSLHYIGYCPVFLNRKIYCYREHLILKQQNTVLIYHVTIISQTKFMKIALTFLNNGVLCTRVYNFISTWKFHTYRLNIHVICAYDEMLNSIMYPLYMNDIHTLGALRLTASCWYRMYTSDACVDLCVDIESDHYNQWQHVVSTSSVKESMGSRN